MPIEFTCACGKRLKAAEALAGRRAKCPRCGTELRVPEIFPPAGAAPACPPPPAPPVVLGTPFDSRRHVLAEAHVVPDASRCVQCGICSFNCPMAIDVRAHARRGRPIHDSRCLTCSECVNRCPRGVLQFERLALFGDTG